MKQMIIGMIAGLSISAAYAQITATPEGFAKELSDQAKVVADQERRLAALEKKVTRITNILKLKSRNGK